jgi:glycosyltransferase involved in cell wall biosynthesis
VRVAWVSHNYQITGGAERAMVAAIEGLRARDVEVAILLPGAGELADVLRPLGVRVHEVPFCWWATLYEDRRLFRWKRTGRNLLHAPAAARVLREFRADVVVTNTLVTPIGAYAAALARLPHVWFMHEMYGPDGHGWRFDLGERLGMGLIRRLSTLVLANSDAVVESYAKYFPRPMLRRVHYPVDVPRHDREDHESTEALRLIQVGRVSAGKRAEDAVQALALLSAKGIDATLTLLGEEDREYASLLRSKIDELGLASRVQFIAFAQDPFAHMAAADVALTCSRGEAFGMVTVEAMKLGKAVVGADSGGTTEVIRDGETGLLFRTGDAQDLAAVLERLHHDRDLVRRLGASARTWATGTFTRERYVTELLDTFEEVRKS